MKGNLRILAALMVAAGLVLSFAFVACSDSDSGDADEPTAATDHMDDGDADHMDDGDTDHMDDGDAEANAHLEAAPKDALFLVEMSSFAYTPNALEVQTGDVVEIAIQNVDSLVHDFTIDEIDADVHVSYLEGTGVHGHAEPGVVADVHFALTEPGSGVVHMQVHEPGEYVFYCTVPGHRESGMEGTLVVTAAE